MKSASRSPILDITISDLKHGMTIVAYTGFESQYSPLDEKTCEWVKHNFKGAMASVVRNETELRDAIANVQPGDHIRAITDIPATLKNICQVNDRLIAELRTRGFTSFQIRQPQAHDSDPASREAQVAKAAGMIDNIKQSIDLCQHATSAVESLMDNTGNAAPNFKEVKDYIMQLSGSDTIQAISAIVSLKENDHVYAHCVDVGVIFQQVYFPIIAKQELESAFKDEQEAMLGAFLHDIGKAQVSKEIITSTKLFKPDSHEIQEIRKHTEYGAQLLSEAGMPDVIVNMAHYHHVKLDETMNSSYPKGITQSEVMFETRLLSIIDTYQALVSGRSYKKSWTPSSVIRYLDAIAGIEFDIDLWNDFQAVMGYYPISTLVKLSDDSLAFVMNVPESDLLNPQVAIVAEAGGSRLSENRLVDLAQEEGLSIKKDIDVKEFFQEDAFAAFSELNIV